MTEPSTTTDDTADAAPSTTVYDPKLMRLAQATPDQLAADPKRFQPVGTQETRMIGPDGAEYTVPASSAQGALNDGWSFLDHDRAAERGVVEQIKREHIGGAVGEGVRSFTNQLLFGAPEIAEQHADPYTQQALRESAEEHATARLIGGTAGFAAGSALSGGVGEAVGSAAEQGTLRALAGAGTRIGEAAVAPGLGARALGYAARGAAEGALYSAPQAIAQASYGDLDKAAESMVWGVGTSGLLGLGMGGFREAASGLGGALRSAAEAHGVLDAAGQIVPEKLGELVGGARRSLLGLTGEGAEKLATSDVGTLERLARSEGLVGAGADKLAAARGAAEAAVDAHAGILDKAVASSSPAATPLGLSPTDLAAKVQEQVLGSRPGLSTPLFSSERATLDKALEQITSHDGDRLSFEDAQKLRDQIRGAAGDASGQKSALLRQVADIVSGEHQRAMGEAYNSLGLTADYGDFLGAKDRLSQLSQLSQLAPAGMTPQGPLAGVVNAIASKPSKAIGGAVGAWGSSLGGPLGGIVGYQVGKQVAGRMLDHAAQSATLGLAQGALRRITESPESFAWLGPALAKSSVDAAGSRVASAVEALGSRAAVAAGPHPFVRALGGDDASGLSRDKQYERVTAALTQAAADPARVAAQAQTMGHAVAGADGNLANAFAQRAIATTNYLAQAVPRDPTTPQPFGGGALSKWAPSAQERADFTAKLAVAQDPSVVLDLVKSGGLTQAHVDALNALYPKTREAIMGELAQAAYAPGAPKLSEGMKLSLEKLTGAELTNPQRIDFQQAYQQAQSSQGPQPQRGARAPKMNHVPSLASGTQALEQRANR